MINRYIFKAVLRKASIYYIVLICQETYLNSYLIFSQHYNTAYDPNCVIYNFIDFNNFASFSENSSHSKN